eukprot:100102-Rhodomonas_salina.1
MGGRRDVTWRWACRGCWLYQSAARVWAVTSRNACSAAPSLRTPPINRWHAFSTVFNRWARARPARVSLSQRSAPTAEGGRATRCPLPPPLYRDRAVPRGNVLRGRECTLRCARPRDGPRLGTSIDDVRTAQSIIV